MRKIMASEFVSLDGVMEAPDRWHVPYFDEDPPLDFRTLDVSCAQVLSTRGRSN